MPLLALLAAVGELLRRVRDTGDPGGAGGVRITLCEHVSTTGWLHWYAPFSLPVKIQPMGGFLRLEIRPETQKTGKLSAFMGARVEKFCTCWKKRE